MAAGNHWEGRGDQREAVGRGSGVQDPAQEVKPEIPAPWVEGWDWEQQGCAGSAKICLKVLTALQRVVSSSHGVLDDDLMVAAGFWVSPTPHWSFTSKWRLSDAGDWGKKWPHLK